MRTWMAPDSRRMKLSALAKRQNSDRKQLAQQNIGQRFHDWSWSALQQIRDAHMDGAGFQTDETVGVGETAELHCDSWQWSARFEFPEDAGVDFFRAFEKQGALKSGDGKARAGVLHFSTI